MASKARYALVVWRDTHSIGAIPLEQVEREMAAGKVFVIAREDADPIEPAQRNPNRTGDEGGD